MERALKVRFLEPGNRPYRPSPLNFFVYDRTIRTPGTGLITLATIARNSGADARVYSESISRIVWEDVLDADVICIGVFTFNAERGYELAAYARAHSRALVVLGGLHASLSPQEAAQYADFVLLGEGDESILDLLAAVRARRRPDFPGLAWLDESGAFQTTGPRCPPLDISTIPDRALVYRYREMAGHNTLWPQVHASRGCPHNCDYCAVVRHFGHGVRTRPPENVVEDIRQALAFHERPGRLLRVLWLTDDNFFADRAWAVSVLRAIIDSGIRCAFTVQARFEVGFDDEMLELLSWAGFTELAMGVEFLEDESFARYHKQSTRGKIVESIRNIRRHGLQVRGLFILGADDQERGVGKKLAAFAAEQDLCGALIQAMYFVPGTPVYEANKDRLLRGGDWSRCTGKAVHFPQKMTPAQLQREVIEASAGVYSFRRLLHALRTRPWTYKLLFLGECLWQASVRADLRAELPELTSLTPPAGETE